MKSILEELAKNNLYPNSQHSKQTPEIIQATKKVSDAENTLLASLCEPEKKLLDDFIIAKNELNHLARVDSFIWGYRLATLIMMEVVQGKGDCFCE